VVKETHPLFTPKARCAATRGMSDRRTSERRVYARNGALAHSAVNDAAMNVMPV